MSSSSAQHPGLQDSSNGPGVPVSEVRDSGSGSARLERGWLPSIVVLYCLLSFTYNIVTPIGEACDELDHIRYVEHLVRYGSFAPISAGGSQMPYTLEAKQPPGFYFLNSALMLGLGRCGQELAPDLEKNPAGPSFGPGSKEVMWFLHPPVPIDLLPWTYIMRFVSMLLGIGTILLTFATAREVFPAREYKPLAFGAAATTAFLPTFTFVSSTVNNDNLAALTGSALSYWLVRALRRGMTVRDGIILGTLTGLVLLSKMNTLAFIPAVFLVLLVGRVRRPGKVHSDATPEKKEKSFAKDLLRWLGARSLIMLAALVMCLLLAGWWYLRNLLVYGDVFAFKAVNQMAAAVLTTAHSATASVAGGGSTWVQQLFMVLGTHFGAFGCVTVKAPLILWLIYMTMLLLALIGLIVVFLRRLINAVQLSQIAVAALVVLLIYATMVYNAVGLGRLLFPAIAFTSLLIAAGTFGLFRLLPRNNAIYPTATAAAILWTAFLAISNAYSLFTVLIPAWY